MAKAGYASTLGATMAKANHSTTHTYPLLKPEVQHIVRKKTQLTAFQDEKRDAYQKHHDIAAEVFQKARDVRAGMQSEYEARNKMVHDKLAEMKKRNDGETLRSLSTLKAFCDEFLEGLESRKKQWKSEFKAGRDGLNKRQQAGTAELKRCDDLIKAEHEECIRHTSAGTGPIIEKLKEEDVFLLKSIDERTAANKDFCDTVEDHFHRLKRTLADESKVRAEECKETHDKAKVLYAELEKQQRAANDSVRTRLEEVRSRVAVETKDTTNSNTWVTHEMMQFMQHFEASVSGALEKQELSKTHLQTLKESFN